MQCMAQSALCATPLLWINHACARYSSFNDTFDSRANTVKSAHVSTAVQHIKVVALNAFLRNMHFQVKFVHFVYYYQDTPAHLNLATKSGSL